VRGTYFFRVVTGLPQIPSRRCGATYLGVLRVRSFVLLCLVCVFAVGSEANCGQCACFVLLTRGRREVWILILESASICENPRLGFDFAGNQKRETRNWFLSCPPARRTFIQHFVQRLA
jgi:hypothetical protein